MESPLFKNPPLLALTLSAALLLCFCEFHANGSVLDESSFDYETKCAILINSRFYFPSVLLFFVDFSVYF